jgi:hypothetical protein
MMDAAIWVQILGGILGALLVGAIGFWLGGRSKQTVAGCVKCQGDCKKDLQGVIDAIKAKQAELSARQDALDDEVSRKLDIVFRMLRAAIQFLPISEKEKAEIINERGGK